MIILKSDKELFNLARDYVMLVSLYEKSRLYEGEFEEEADRIRNTVLEKGYDVDKFVEYQKLYKNMSMKEYFDFVRTLD